MNVWGALLRTFAMFVNACQKSAQTFTIPDQIFEFYFANKDETWTKNLSLVPKFDF